MGEPNSFAIYYCDKCGQRIAPGDLQSGAAVARKDGESLCASCRDPRPKPSGRATTTRSGRVSVQSAGVGTGIPASPASTSPSRSGERPAAKPAPPRAPGPKGKPALLVAGAGAVIFMIGIASLLLRPKPQAPATADADRKRPESGKTAGSGDARTPLAPGTGGHGQEAHATEEQRKLAAEELSKIRQYRADNPADTEGLYVQLRNMLGKYSGTPAAEEASRLLGALRVAEDVAAAYNWHKDWQLGGDNARVQWHESFDHRRFVLETHPPAGQQPLLLTRKVKVPGDKAFLECAVRAQDNGDCEVWVEANGRKTPPQTVGGNVWRRFAVDLAAWKEQEVTLALGHKAAGRSAEPAYWQAPLFVSQPAGGAQTLALAAAPSPAPAAPVVTPGAPAAPSPPAPQPTAGRPPDDEAEETLRADWKRATNLVALVRPAEDAVAGTWRLQGGALVCERLAYARLALPYEPPEEYDFRIIFTEHEGNECVSLLLSHAGRGFVALLGGWKNVACGFEKIQGKGASDNPTTVKRESILEMGRKHIAVVRVRQNGFRLILDGTSVCGYRTNYQDVSPAEGWVLGGGRELRLGVGAFNSRVTFHAVEVCELSGKGKRLRQSVVRTSSGAPADEKSFAPLWLANLQELFEACRFEEARQRAAEARLEPTLAAHKAALEQDEILIRHAEELGQAALKGLALLKDGRAFALQKSDGAALPVGAGAPSRVLEVKDGAAEIEQGAGSGKITRRMSLEQLALRSWVELAWLALPDDPAGRFKRALGAVLRYREGAAEPSLQEIGKMLDKAAQEAQPAGTVGRLRTWLAQAERESAAKAAFEKLKSPATPKQQEEVRKALESFRKEFAETAFLAEAQPQLAALETQWQPGLWAMFYSGDQQSKFRRFHTARAEGRLNYDWGGGAPAPGVPGDWFGIRFRGVLRVEKGGTHEFLVAADDEIAFYLDGQGLCAFNNCREVRVKIALGAGDHELRILYAEQGGGARLKVLWQPPGKGQMEDIPTSALYYRPAMAERYQKE